MKFVIQLHTGNFSEKDGGLTVLLNIAKSLHEHGQESWVRLPDNSCGYENNRLYTNYFNEPHVDDDTTAIYIDCTTGNPLKARRVVRIITYGSHWYPNYDSNEIIYYHAPFCKNNRPNKTLCMVYLNPITKNLNLPRSGSCYIVKKGVYDPKVREAFSNKVIPAIDLNGKSIEDVVHILNTTKYFFCYDPCCFLIIMALMCGCIVIQHPVTGCNQEEWQYSIGCDFLGRFNGLAYGYDNIDWAEATIADAPDQCMKLINNTEEHIKSFIKDMETGNYGYTPCYKFNDSPYALQFMDRRI
jgi:hypothetical protein